MRLPHHQHRVLVPRQPLEPHGDSARGSRRLVHDDEPEGPGAEQDVGAPPRTLGAARADDPEGAEVGEVRRRLRSEGARGVHERHPLVGPERRLGEGEEERGATAAEGRVEGGDLSAR